MSVTYCTLQSLGAELTSCDDDVRRLQGEAESMTSRTGHVMAGATLQALDERLRDAQTKLSSTATPGDVVSGLTTSSALTVSSNNEVVPNTHVINCQEILPDSQIRAFNRNRWPNSPSPNLVRRKSAEK